FLPVLNELAKDKDPSVRHWAALALARYGAYGQNAVVIFEDLLARQPRLLRDVDDVAALIALGPPARSLHPKLMDQFRGEFDFNSKARLAEAALVIDRDRAAPALAWLHEQFKLGAPAQRAVVAHALAKADAKNPEVLKWLLVQANDTN